VPNATLPWPYANSPIPCTAPVALLPFARCAKQGPNRQQQYSSVAFGT